MLTVAQRSISNREKSTEFVRGRASRLPWAWDQLCFGAPMPEWNHAEGLRDIASGIRHSSVTSNTWIKDDRGNPTAHIFGFVQYPDAPAHDRPDTELTAYVRARIIGTNSNTGFFCMPHTTGVSPFMTWGIQTDAGGLDKLTAMLTVGGSPTQLADSAVITHTRYVTMALRWRSGEAPQFDVYDERGNLLSSVVHGTTVTGSLTYAAGQGLRINCTDDTTTTGRSDANYSQAMLWSRRLTDAELTALVADPFGWYGSRRETLLMAGPWPVFPPPTSVAAVSGTSPYSGAGIAPTFGAAGVVTSYTVTAGQDVPADFTRTVSGVTTTDTVAAGDTQVYPTGATTAADVTYVALDSDDTGV